MLTTGLQRVKIRRFECWLKMALATEFGQIMHRRTDYRSIQHFNT